MIKALLSNTYLKMALIFALFFIIPMALSTVFGYQTVGGYLSPLLLLILTWLLYKKENKDLSILGLTFKSRQVYFLPLGIVGGILFLSIMLFFQMLHNGLQIHINKEANYALIFGGIFLLLQGVLNEELIFRGYCFKKSIEQIGIVKANVLFAFLFIVFHWIATSAWGNYGLMLSLCITGLGHLFFATALQKSGTLYFPIGLHLGNNWAQRYLFSAKMGGINTNPSNDVLFILTTTQTDFSTAHVAVSYAITIVWMITSIFIIWQWKK